MLESGDTLVELRENSSLYNSLLKEVADSLIAPLSFPYHPVKVELVINTTLADDFININEAVALCPASVRSDVSKCVALHNNFLLFTINKAFALAVKKEYELRAEEEYEYKENFAFLSVSEQALAEICHSGYICTDSTFNILGLSKYGVYLCKHADVCINEANLHRTENIDVPFHLLIFKYVPGKQTTALVRKGPKILPISPTPNFNSHCSVIAPKDFDDLETQFDRSQIYLYEFKGKLPTSKPRQCIPYAVITLCQSSTQSGSYNWKTNYTKLCTLHADALRCLFQSDDESVNVRLNEDENLKKYVIRASERNYEELKPNISEPSYRKSAVAVQNSSKSSVRSNYNFPCYSLPRMLALPNLTGYMVYRASNGLTYAVQPSPLPSYIVQSPAYIAPSAAPGIPGTFYRLPISPLLSPQQQLPCHYTIIAPSHAPLALATPRPFGAFSHQQIITNGTLQLAPAAHYVQNVSEIQQPQQVTTSEETACPAVQEYCVSHHNYAGAGQVVQSQAPPLPQGYVLAAHNNSSLSSQDGCISGAHEIAALSRPPAAFSQVQTGPYQMLNLNSAQQSTGIQSSFPGSPLTVSLSPAQAAATSSLVQHAKSMHGSRHHPYAR